MGLNFQKNLIALNWIKVNGQWYLVGHSDGTLPESATLPAPDLM